MWYYKLLKYLSVGFGGKMLEQVMLKETVEIIRIKQQSVFDLLDIPFYQEDFCFFPELALALGEDAEITAEQASKFGILSEIIHLSSKIHLSISILNERGGFVNEKS